MKKLLLALILMLAALPVLAKDSYKCPAGRVSVDEGTKDLVRWCGNPAALYFAADTDSELWIYRFGRKFVVFVVSGQRIVEIFVVR